LYEKVVNVNENCKLLSLSVNGEIWQIVKLEMEKSEEIVNTKVKAIINTYIHTYIQSTDLKNLSYD